MASGKRNLVIVGGGIAGLVAALVALRRNARGADIHLINNESAAGGLLRTIDYGNGAKFDLGMHVFHETGVAALDDILFSILRPEEMHVLSGNRRDLAGLYYNGKLRINAPQIDIRDYPEDRRDDMVRDFLESAAKEPFPEKREGLAYSAAKFGAAITEQAIRPAAEKLFCRPLEELETMALKITGIDRVILFSEQSSFSYMKSDEIRRRLGFPEQRNLPLEYSSQRKGFYPKRFGMQTVVDRVIGELKAAGVSIHNSAQIKAIEKGPSGITAVQLSGPDGNSRIAHISQLFWSVNLFSLLPLLQLPKPSGGPPDTPLTNILVNLLIKSALQMGDLYYFYCYEPGMKTFRVTSFSAYCEGAVVNGECPVCLEMWFKPEELGAPAEQIARGVEELTRFGVIASPADVSFARVEALKQGFPMPTLKNVAGLRSARQTILAQGPQNLHLIGSQADDGIFFQGDVLANVYQKLAVACGGGS